MGVNWRKLEVEAPTEQETEKLGEYLLYLTREPAVLLYNYVNRAESKTKIIRLFILTT